LMLNERGDWIRGWEVKGKDGQMYPCGVLCDRQAVDYARRRISAELKTHPYHCRFIDTTTASPWRECDSPDHPCTRTESRKFKMDLLGVVCDECGLVTGSETGHDAAVPVAHYFEGMLSLGPYRVPDSGRNTMQAVLDVPERVAKFQTGHFYRLPLWELVYHDCVVAQWYWGDYNNKLPSLWDRRDLWNALYGTPPMYMFTQKIWNDNRDRFVQSYKASTPVARATGYVEMLSHRWLTEDHSVQQTQFANGVKVTVNFGDKPYTLADGSSLAPLSQRVEGLK
ncbi:MAG: glycoside hydrolase, partial [Thermoguttaceae bacterium]